MTQHATSIEVRHWRVPPAVAALGVLLLAVACRATQPAPAPELPQLAASPQALADRVELTLNGGVLRFLVGSEHTKPALTPIFSPSGTRVTRSWPLDVPHVDDSRDHPHHTSQWIAHGAVCVGDELHDFWHAPDTERIVCTELSERTSAEGHVVAARFDWRAGESTLLREALTMLVKTAGNAVRIDYDVRLSAAQADVVFADTKEGFFGLRLHPHLRVRGDAAHGALLDSEGRRNADCWGKRARWVVASGAVDGREVAVAIFDHPLNPRHPSYWHVREYGLMAANPFGVSDFTGAPQGSGDFELRQGEPVRFRYQIVVMDGPLDVPTLEVHYSDFVTSNGD